MMAHIRLSRRTCGWSSKWRGSTILLRTVSATRSPTATLPANSQTDAIIMACFKVSDLDDTEVANELATSLAPSWSVQVRRHCYEETHQYSTRRGRRRWRPLQICNQIGEELPWCGDPPKEAIGLGRLSWGVRSDAVGGAQQNQGQQQSIAMILYELPFWRGRV